MTATLTEKLQQIEVLKQELDKVRPLLDKSILEAIDVEYTYDSNRIEGNTLTLRETEIVINKGLTIACKSMREHLEANNHYEAILFIRELVQKDTEITESVIKDIHAVILQGIDRENAGKYRIVPVAISGSRHIPPPPLKVPELMEELGKWTKEEASELHPIVFAAELHERIATIHPFIDGNGRTARLLMNLVLLRNGYSITDIPGDTKSRLAYYDALERCNIENDKTAFLLLIPDYTYSGMKNLIEKVKMQ